MFKLGEVCVCVPRIEEHGPNYLAKDCMGLQGRGSHVLLILSVRTELWLGEYT